MFQLLTIRIIVIAKYFFYKKIKIKIVTHFTLKIVAMEFFLIVSSVHLNFSN